MTMCELAGESRNVTAEATSLASATRPVGMRGRITSKLPLAKSSIVAWSLASWRIISVSVGPGETVLMRTPLPATSMNNTRRAWRRAALDAEYAARRIRGIRFDVLTPDASDTAPLGDGNMVPGRGLLCRLPLRLSAELGTAARDRHQCGGVRARDEALEEKGQPRPFLLRSWPPTAPTTGQDDQTRSHLLLPTA